MIKFLWGENTGTKQTIFRIIFLALLIFITDVIVYISGGTSFAYTHLMYIPIMLGASFYGMKGGLITSLFAGMALGPYMPLHVTRHIMQENISWIIRLFLFAFIGTIFGFLNQSYKKVKENEIKSLYKHVQTGYPNSNKLKIDLHELVKAGDSFTIVIFEILNYDQINLYTNYETGGKAVFQVIDILEDFFDENIIYSIYTNIISVTLPFYSVKKAIASVKQPLHYFDKPIYIDGLPLNINIKCGIVNFPLHGKYADDLFLKLLKTIRQNPLNKEQITVYDKTQIELNKKNYNAIISLNNAINNNKFTIVYQPKISAKSYEITGFEALLRWNKENDTGLNTGEFIKLAESAGMITEITKWTIKNVLLDMKFLQSKGIYVKIAINISYLDLRNNHIFHYTKNLLKKHEINPSYLEFELTERSIYDSSSFFDINTLLHKMRDFGIKISIDDFGTGYNTFIHLMNLPIDHVKIDKVFIDNCDTSYCNAIVESIIKSAHSVGMEVIAEGVETEKQLEVLRQLDCDTIQGYYYSRPLPFDKMIHFIETYENVN